MRINLRKRIVAWFLCGMLLIGAMPLIPIQTLATENAQADDLSFFVPFFQGTTMETATFAGEFLTCTNANGLVSNKHGQYAGFDRVPYLETNKLSVGDVITMTGLVGIPYGTYRIDLVAKSGSTRGTVQVKLDDTLFEPKVDMRIKTNAENVDDALGSNSLWAWTLSDNHVIITPDNAPHTLQFTVTGAGKCMLYGLRLTPVGELPVTVHDENVNLDLVEYDATNEGKDVSYTVRGDYGQVDCKSDDEQIVTVESFGDGKLSLKPVSIGQTTVTITAAHKTMGGVTYSAQIPVHVTDSVVKVNPVFLAIDLKSENRSREVSAIVDPRFTIEEWSTDVPGVVSISGNGATVHMTGLQEGVATVTVKAVYEKAVRTATMTVKVVNGALTFPDTLLDANRFVLREDVHAGDIHFNDLEWTGLTVGGQKMSDVIEINRVTPHANLLSYQSVESAILGAVRYEREQSDYYMSLTTKEDLDPTTSDWKFAFVDSMTKDANYTYMNTVADPYAAGRDLRDFYQVDYDVSAWPGIAVPSSWNVQGVDQNGIPYTGYYDTEYGYDPPYYINTVEPQYITVNGVNRSIYKDVAAPYAPWDYNPVGFYRTSFSVPKEWIENKNKVFLNFGGVEAVFYVYINGEEVGYHEDSKTLGEFDITPFLTDDGQDNVLAVKVLRWSDSAWLENQDMIRFAGIFREVYLTATPAVHIQDYKVETDLSEDYTDATLKLNVQVMNYTENLDISRYQVVTHLFDPDGNDLLIGNNLILKLSEGTEGEHSATVSGEVSVYAPHLWYPDDPYLYTLVISLVDPDTGAIEHISQQLGFREITYRKEEDRNQWDVIRINGKKITMYGTNYTDVTPYGGRYVSPETYEEDLKIIKQNNFNTVRTSHSPKDPYFLYLADKYGLMVVLEANNESHPLVFTMDVRDHLRHAFYSRVENMIECEKNRTSVVMWSLGNETGRQGDMAYEIMKQSRSLDSTRPFHYEQMHDSVYGGSDDIDYSADVTASMYATPSDYLAWCKNTSRFRSYFICEFAHSSGNASGHLAEYADAFRSSNLAMGGCTWEFVDQAVWTKMTAEDEAIMKWDLYADIGRSKFYLGYGGDWQDGGEGNNVGCCEGIVNALREPEPEMVEAKKMFQALNFMADDADLLQKTVHIRNEYYATDASSFAYTWYVYENGSLYDSGAFDVPSIPAFDSMYDVVYNIPTVALDVPYKLPEQLRDGAEYFLKIEVTTKESTEWAGAGHVIAWEQFQLPVKTGTVSAPVIEGDVTVDESGEAYTVFGANFSMIFDKKDGRMKNYTVNGEVLLLEGPVPQFDRLQTRRDRSDVTESVFLDVQSKLYETTITVEDTQSFAVITVNYTVKTRPKKSHMTMTYRVYANGAVYTTMELETSINNGLYRFGVDMEMPVGFTDMEYYARGPQDNFVDRLSGTDIGRYTTKVADNFFPFVHNEPTGDHQEARWMALSGEGKKSNLMFVATDSLMAVNALHISLEELSQDHVTESIRQNYGHPFQLNNNPLEKTTIVSLSGATRGTGGGQNGVLSQYRVTSGNMSFSFAMVPYTIDQDLQDVADPYRHTLTTADVETVELNMTETTMSVGDKLVLLATLTPSGLFLDQLSWESDNQAVATVQNGEITAVGVGTARIIVRTESGQSAICVLTVTEREDLYRATVLNMGYANSVTLTVDTGVTVSLKKDGKTIPYELGQTITLPGVYEAVFTDSNGQTDVLSFTVVGERVGNLTAMLGEIQGFEKVTVNGTEASLTDGVLSLTENGTYEICITADGVVNTFTVTVDATPPTITLNGVENGGTTKSSVVISSVSEEACLKVFWNQEEISYTLGDELTQIGAYRILVDDGVHVTEYTFTIEENNMGIISVVVGIAVAVVVLLGAGICIFVVLKKKKKN